MNRADIKCVWTTYWKVFSLWMGYWMARAKNEIELVFQMNLENPNNLSFKIIMTTSAIKLNSYIM